MAEYTWTNSAKSNPCQQFSPERRQARKAKSGRVLRKLCHRPYVGGPKRQHGHGLPDPASPAAPEPEHAARVRGQHGLRHHDLHRPGRGHRRPLRLPRQGHQRRRHGATVQLRERGAATPPRPRRARRNSGPAQRLSWALHKIQKEKWMPSFRSDAACGWCRKDFHCPQHSLCTHHWPERVKSNPC